MRTDLCQDGDTGEWAFMVYLDTKDEKIAMKRASKYKFYLKAKLAEVQMTRRLKYARKSKLKK